MGRLSERVRKGINFLTHFRTEKRARKTACKLFSRPKLNPKYPKYEKKSLSGKVYFS
mgnify:CR=1 FL=1